MSGITPHGIRYPDGASKVKDFGPEMKNLAEDLDDLIYTELGSIAGPIVDAAIDAVLETEVAEALEETPFLFFDELGAVRTLAINDSMYSEVRLSYDFRRVGGTLREGGEVGTDPNALESAISPGAGVVTITHDFRRAQPGHDNTGLTPQHVLDEWARRLPTVGAFLSLTGWGDSMTTTVGSPGTSQTLALAAELGVTGYDRGISGDSATAIAWRMGALPWRVTVPGGVIPASGAVPAQIEPALGHRAARDWPCTLLDKNGNAVQVILHNEAGQGGTPMSFTVEQVAGTSARTILPETRIAHAHTLDRLATSAPATLWVGRNDPDEGRVIAALTAMLAQHRDPANRVLVRPIFNTTDEPAGSPGYANIMAINAAIADLAGSSFYDSRAALIANGLTLAGITPTPADTTAIGEDRIPLSLMADSIHLNAAGKLALARLDAIEISGRNW